ncbi:Mpv17 / PMP22 family [Seminavis robusta]|nr:Mpv17 / PMP22 family [Seminavis robusta]|eukprot:Sro671_g184980.1 Mpv17 / PMP22 family (202) ;mRNA; r:52997-53602
MTLEDVNTFYQTYPLQAAVLTCGVKASLADCVAQIRSWTSSERAIELRRNAAYIIYGGIFIGLMCHIEYDIVFPHLFGTNHDLKNVVESVLFDNFVSAPLMWLPPVYFIKAVMFDYPLSEGLDKYLSDIRDEGLLYKYWAVWLPAQTISFSCVPDHMRVLFMACISFGWFIILSSCQSTGDSVVEAVTEETLAATTIEAST